VSYLIKETVLSGKQLDAFCKEVGLTSADWDEGGGFVHEAVVRVIQQARQDTARKVTKQLREWANEGKAVIAETRLIFLEDKEW